MSDDILERGGMRARELGLCVAWNTGSRVLYEAKDIHRLFGSAIPVKGASGDSDPITWYDEASIPDETHQALLIGIRPIKQESEERKLLRELIEHGVQIVFPYGWYDKAKALLAKGEK